MIKTIEKPCPGDCSICTYPNEIVGFDMYGCALNQTLQRTIRMEQQMQEIKDRVFVESSDNEEKIIIKHKEDLNNDESSYETLPEQDGQK